MSGAAYIDKTGIDLSHAGVEERPGLWSNYLHPFHDVAMIGDSAATKPPCVNAWLLGKVVVCETRFGSSVRHRGKKHLSNDFDEFLLLDVRRKGVQHNDFGTESIKFEPGDVTVFDYTSTYRCRGTAVDFLNLFVPHSAVGYDPTRHPKIIRFPGDSVIGHVLSNTIFSVFSMLDCTLKSEASAISRGLIGLLRGILFDNPNTLSPSFAAARSRAIRDYIEHNLGARKLNADVISATFHVSRATVYRDFKDDGGLERYIVGRKLEAALDALSFGLKARGAVSRAAEQWGFASTGHFASEFRRRFGFFPSEIVAEATNTQDRQEFRAVVRDEREPDQLAYFMSRL
ncbi:MAG: AraC family transcriptional regulator [Pseudomonadota bacterium]